MKKGYVLFVVSVFMLAITYLFTTTASAQTFKDVSSEKEYYEAVELLAEIGAISKSNGNFNPNGIVTRGQASKMIAISFGLDIENVKDPRFSDVPKSNGFYPYVAALANEGIIGGYSNGSFGVNDKLTRSQMAKILSKALGVPLTSGGEKYFKDLTESTEIYDYVDTLAFYHIVNTSQDHFRPSANLTRSQLALFIQRSLDIMPVIATEVRVPVADVFGASKDEVYILNPEVVYVALNVKSNELILQPEAEGQTAVYAEGVANQFLLIDVVEKNGELQVKTKTSSTLPLQYKSLISHDFESRDDFLIHHYFVGDIGSEEEKDSEDPTMGEDEYYPNVTFTIDNPNEKYLFTLRSMEDVYEQYIMTAEEVDLALVTKAHELVEEPTVSLLYDMSQVDSVELIEGDESAFDVRFTSEQINIDLKAEGYFALTVKLKDGSYSPYIHVFDVAEYEGKLGLIFESFTE
ncbi:S-layer homology domain-containing protein [Lysinibacillus sp. LZ02]|uniref:S-layer homology domain-containing protein n=1 Tax=Lysinibacillus sp. LZ02 TaxID=3420668 RepID=UPI003D35D160